MAGPTVISPALILGSIRYGETSRIVRLATRDLGVVGAIAKGALRPRSRFGASLQTLSEGMAHLVPPRSGELHILAAFDLHALHHGLASDLERFAAASALAEVATRFVPPSPNPAMYHHLVQSVALLEAVPPEAVQVVGLRAMWQLAAGLGLAPSLDRCARDGAALPEGGVVFSMRDGGLLCGRCGAGGGTTRLASDDHAALRAFITPGLDLPILDVPHAAAHRRLLVRWIHHHLSDAAMPALEAWREMGPSG